ncbi:MAG: GNAT family N-acetyltransferase [Faecalibacterium sp.]
MIAQVNTPQRRMRYRNACRGRLYLGAAMPLSLKLFGKSQPWRFYAGPTLALDVGGSAARMSGHADPEELASFLTFCGCRAVILDEKDGTPPEGWRRERNHHIFALEPGVSLPLPPVDQTLWDSLALNADPSSGMVADALFADRPNRRDDFYSELCTKRSHGAARVWTLERQGRVLCTVGAYALYDGQAYLACGQTEPALRGRGIGGRLIVHTANSLAAEGWRVDFLCADERVHFYTRLGFAHAGLLARYTAP